MGIADELITRGWATGVNEADDGSVCLVGAALHAYGRGGFGMFDYALAPHVRAALSTAIETVDPNTPRSEYTGRAVIFAFNDRNREDGDKVLRVAKLADEILDAG
jgi:hypothetical protein